jgi:hypothetical protein
MAIESLAVGVEEDRTVDPFPDGQVDSTGDARGEWHRHQLAALAQHGQCSMAAFQPEGFDVRVDRRRDAQPVQRQK